MDGHKQVAASPEAAWTGRIEFQRNQPGENPPGIACHPAVPSSGDSLAILPRHTQALYSNPTVLDFFFSGLSPTHHFGEEHLNSRPCPPLSFSSSSSSSLPSLPHSLTHTRNRRWVDSHPLCFPRSAARLLSLLAPAVVTTSCLAYLSPRPHRHHRENHVPEK
ncbi:hypothetical protein VTN96DRAFT_7759 [Rasamsonia emersonii]